MKEFRVVALGDSLTYGYGVLSHIAFPFRLAAELPEKHPELDCHHYLFCKQHVTYHEY